MKRLSFIVVVFLISMPQKANAGLFGPSNQQDCLTGYAAKAGTKVATSILIGACENLFLKELNFEEYKDDQLRSQKLTLAQLDKFMAQKGRITPEKANQNLLDGYKKYKADKTREKQKAQCTINLTELYKVQNDVAAHLIYNNSKCGQSE